MGPESIVVVGASIAGMNAAHTLRKEGFEGRLSVIDADTRAPYDRPPLSKQVLRGDWDADRVTLAAASEDLSIDWHLGARATSLDLSARTVSVDAAASSSRAPGVGAAGSHTISFDALVVATGASARRLPGTEGIAGIHVLRTLDDCLALRSDLDEGPDRVVVIGAGFIGAEVAASCRERGLEVTLVEALDVPLERVLGRNVGLLVADLHRENGVDVRLGASVAGFDTDDTGRVSGVRLVRGDTVSATVVVVGIGVVPSTGWLEGSGLNLDNGVVVDDTLLAAPGVAAAGDIARRPSARFGGMLRIEHWENAVQMGEHAARRLLLADGAEPPRYDPVPWFWSDQYDRKIQLAGLSSSDDQFEVVHGSLEDRRFVALYGRGDRVVGVVGMNRPRHVMQLRQLVLDEASWADGVAAGRALT